MLLINAFYVKVVKEITLNIPAGTKRIEEEAFKNCANMRKAEIPNSVTSIADDAFDGCAEGFVIIALAGSYAAEYAVAHGYTE